MELKSIFGVISVVLAFAAIAPYIWDIFKRKTTPHMFTWAIGTLAVAITAMLQFIGGAGGGAWMTATIAGLSGCVFVLSFWYGTKDITRMDGVCFILALMALGLWLVVNQPVWSLVLIISIDVLGFAPTVRKSWSKPYEETLIASQISAVRSGASILALQQFTLLTAVYPVISTFLNIAFSAFLMVRRRRVKALAV